MPSYVIHHIAGNKLLDKYIISDKQKGLFLLGNLIPDSIKTLGNETDSVKVKAIRDKFYKQIQHEKAATHFRRREDFNKNVELPYLEDFSSRYGHLFDDPTVLGYYYHLYVDKYFFSTVFDETFECLDSNGNKTDLSADTRTYKILKNGKIVTPDVFWSHAGIYDDYTKMNKILLEKYGVTFDEGELRKVLPFFINPGIEEVDYANIEVVFRETNGYIAESKAALDTSLNVFDQDKVVSFINDVSTKFENDNPDLIQKLIKK
jgi:hypothetical protein